MSKKRSIEIRQSMFMFFGLRPELFKSLMHMAIWPQTRYNLWKDRKDILLKWSLFLSL